MYDKLLFYLSLLLPETVHWSQDPHPGGSEIFHIITNDIQLAINPLLCWQHVLLTHYNI